MGFIVRGRGWGGVPRDRISPRTVFDLSEVRRPFLDPKEWISTDSHVMMNFDHISLYMVVFDIEEGFSTNAD
jgi:hypothetical protein